MTQERTLEIGYIHCIKKKKTASRIFDTPSVFLKKRKFRQKMFVMSTKIYQINLDHVENWRMSQDISSKILWAVSPDYYALKWSINNYHRWDWKNIDIQYFCQVRSWKKSRLAKRKKTNWSIDILFFFISVLLDQDNVNGMKLKSDFKNEQLQSLNSVMLSRAAKKLYLILYRILNFPRILNTKNILSATLMSTSKIEIIMCLSSSCLSITNYIEKNNYDVHCCILLWFSCIE